jgi:hypothetical protein
MSTRIKLTDIPTRPNRTCDKPLRTTRPKRLPLADLPWEDFELLCTRIARAGSDNEFVHSYGLRGQSQEGIDLYIRNTAGRYTVWQCKRHQNFKSTNLTSAVRDFVKAIRSGTAGIPIKEAEKLVIAVTADLSDTNILNELERQSKRLRPFGVSLVLMDIQLFCDELKKHHEIVADFFGLRSADDFCGPRGFGGISTELVTPAFSTALRSAQEGLSSYGNQDLDRIRDVWGEGRLDETEKELERFQSSTNWPLLKPEVQAKALRMLSGLLLGRGNVNRARELRDVAKSLAPLENSRALEARFSHHEKGPSGVLNFLTDPKTDDERVFRWHSLLQLGRSKEVVDESNSIARDSIPSGDYASVVALAHLAELEVARADQIIRGALQTKPRHMSCRQVAGMVDYYWGISTTFPGWRHMIWPLPLPWNLVKHDDESTERRRHASQMFADLAGSAKGEDNRMFCVWQLACIMIDPKGAEPANALVHRWLLEDPSWIQILTWASAFDLQFDRAPSICVLKRRLETGVASLNDLFVLLTIVDDPGGMEREKLLTQYGFLFLKDDRESLLHFHRAQILLEEGNYSAAIELAKSVPNCPDQLQIQIALPIRRERRCASKVGLRFMSHLAKLSC